MTVTESYTSLTFVEEQLSEPTWSVREIAEEHEGRWTVRDYETGIFGSGATIEAATEDFEQALREHLDVLERQGSLSRQLYAQLAYLRHRLS